METLKTLAGCVLGIGLAGMFIMSKDEIGASGKRTSTILAIIGFVAYVILSN